MRFFAYALLLAISFGSTSCLSSSSVSAFAERQSDCRLDPDLIGEWRSRRISQLGPATMTVTFGCDCRYVVRASSLLGRIHEQGEYRAENGSVVFSRSQGETNWPYRVDGKKLQLTEAADETHDYVRTNAVSCSP